MFFPGSPTSEGPPGTLSVAASTPAAGSVCSKESRPSRTSAATQARSRASHRGAYHTTSAPVVNARDDEGSPSALAAGVGSKSERPAPKDNSWGLKGGSSSHLAQTIGRLKREDSFKAASLPASPKHAYKGFRPRDAPKGDTWGAGRFTESGLSPGAHSFADFRGQPNMRFVITEDEAFKHNGPAAASASPPRRQAGAARRQAAAGAVGAPAGSAGRGGGVGAGGGGAPSGRSPTGLGSANPTNPFSSHAARTPGARPNPGGGGRRGRGGPSNPVIGSSNPGNPFSSKRTASRRVPVATPKRAQGGAGAGAGAGIGSVNPSNPFSSARGGATAGGGRVWRHPRREEGQPGTKGGGGSAGAAPGAGSTVTGAGSRGRGGVAGGTGSSGALADARAQVDVACTVGVDEDGLATLVLDDGTHAPSISSSGAVLEVVSASISGINRSDESVYESAASEAAPPVGLESVGSNRKAWSDRGAPSDPDTIGHTLRGAGKSLLSHSAVEVAVVAASSYVASPKWRAPSSRRTCRDGTWAGAFLVAVAGVAALAVLLGAPLVGIPTPGSVEEAALQSVVPSAAALIDAGAGLAVDASIYGTALVALGLSLVPVSVWAVASVAMLAQSTRGVMRWARHVATACLVLGGLAIVSLGGYFVGLMPVFAAGLIAWCWRGEHRLRRHAAAVTATAGAALAEFRGLFGVAALVCVLQVAWLLLCGLAALGVAAEASEYLLVPMLFVYLWGMEVLRLVCGNTTVALVAQPWFQRAPPDGGLLQAAGVAVGPSFGSACMAAAVTGASGVCRHIAGSGVARALPCLRNMAEADANHYTRFGQAHSVCVGSSCPTASHETFALFMTRSCACVLRTDILAWCVSSLALIGACLGAGTACVYLGVVGPGFRVAVPVSVLAFMGGRAVCETVTEVLLATAGAVQVATLRKSTILRSSFPVGHAEITNAWHSRRSTRM